MAADQMLCWVATASCVIAGLLGSWYWKRRVKKSELEKLAGNLKKTVAEIRNEQQPTKNERVTDISSDIKEEISYYDVGNIEDGPPDNFEGFAGKAKDMHELLRAARAPQTKLSDEQRKQARDLETFGRLFCPKIGGSFPLADEESVDETDLPDKDTPWLIDHVVHTAAAAESSIDEGISEEQTAEDAAGPVDAATSVWTARSEVERSFSDEDRAKEAEARNLQMESILNLLHEQQESATAEEVLAEQLKLYAL